MASDMNTTGKQLVEHWNWAAEKGVMNSHSAHALRAACTNVLGVVENWQEIDIAGINVDDVVQRFKNKRARDFSPSSLDAYERRFRNAVASFLAYAKNPSSWKPSARSKRVPSKLNGKGHEKRARKRAGETVSSKDESVDSTPSRGLIDYPFPLRDKQVARLLLPRDITVAEVKRIYGFILALAVDSGEAT
jgi:hypothetical protein